MKEKIIFLGGIYGVGKSTLCKQISKKFKIKYLSASKLIKHKSLQKKVKNVKNNQNILIKNLKKALNKKSTYLLDGHFVLLDMKNKISKIPLSTYIKINPCLIIVIKDNINTIKKRLSERDRISYNSLTLIKLQKNEIEHAQFVAKHLNISCHITKKDAVLRIIEKNLHQNENIT